MFCCLKLSLLLLFIDAPKNEDVIVPIPLQIIFNNPPYEHDFKGNYYLYLSNTKKKIVYIHFYEQFHSSSL